MTSDVRSSDGQVIRLPSAEVAIIGAGPVGLTAGILLGQRGIATVVLERHPSLYPLPRAIHLDGETRRTLQAMKLAERFGEISSPGIGIRLVDNDYNPVVEFRRDKLDDTVSGWPEANFYDQPDLESLMRARAAELAPTLALRGNLDVATVDEVAGHDRAVRITGREFNGGDLGAPFEVWADYVLGCDGANSLVRTLVGGEFEDLGFPLERWMVVDVRTDRPLEQWGGAVSDWGTWTGVDQVCDTHNPATFGRYGENRFRWEFRMGDDDTIDSLTEPATFTRLMAPWASPEVVETFHILRRAQYNFVSKIAATWRKGRVFLLGDAAHLTPPFIGQGTATGMRDALNLSWKLAAVLRGVASDSLLDTYQEEREPHGRAMILKAMAIGDAMTGGHGPDAPEILAAIHADLQRPGAGDAVLSTATPPLVPGTIVVDDGEASVAGALIPQPTVTVDGTAVRLDDVLGTGFAIVSAVPLDSPSRRGAEAVGATVVALEGTPGAADAAVVVGDAGMIHDWMDRAGIVAAVIRPDRAVLGTVAAGAVTANLAPLLEPLAAHFPALNAAVAR